MSPSNAPTHANADQEQAEGQALFFSNPFPLQLERHAQAGLKKDVGFNFASNVNSVLLNLDEVAEAARCYPIVLSSDALSPRPIAVLGLEGGNQFVNAAGEWDKQAYIPAYVRRYPFGLAPVPDSSEMMLCIDEDAPHYDVNGGDIALYEGDQPSKLAQDALQFCAAFQRQWAATGQFGEALAKAGLVGQKQLEAKKPDGSSNAIRGFQMIDAEKWDAFASTHANEWHANRYLTLVTLILASQANWKYLAQR